MILVTGGTGFIGTHLLERLVAPAVANGAAPGVAHGVGPGEPVRALVRRTRVPRTLPAGVEAVYGDLATGEGIEEALRGADAVIHLAGVTKALRTNDYYVGNVRATERLAQAMAGRGVRLVHVSSLAAVGPSTDEVPVNEDTEARPVTHYGKSKLEAERIVRDLAPDAVIVRPPVVYGPRDTDVFPLLKSISRGLVLELAGGERWFSAIYVKDLLEGLLAALGTPGAAGRTYFLGHPTPLSWGQFGATAAYIMDRTPRVLTVPVAVAHAVGACAELWAWLRRKPGIVSREKIDEARCMAWMCDSSRAAAELGFVAPTSLDRGLAATLAWYKEAGWLNY
jgi:nucleoside-diphosphate-sugar epimerase